MARTPDRAILSRLVDAYDRIAEESLGMGDPEFHEIEDQLREPEPDELLFTDLPHLEHLEAMLVGDIKSAGLDTAFIYAFDKTGLLVSEENQHLIPDNDLEEWRSAVEDYRSKHSEGQSQGARGQVSLDERRKHGLSARGGQGLPGG